MSLIRKNVIGRIQKMDNLLLEENNFKMFILLHLEILKFEKHVFIFKYFRICVSCFD